MKPEDKRWCCDSISQEKTVGYSRQREGHIKLQKVANVYFLGELQDYSRLVQYTKDQGGRRQRCCIITYLKL